MAPRNRLKSAAAMSRLMAAHFEELNTAAQTGERKVAWCSSVGPAELLRGMGFLVYFPENHGAMLGATRMATDCIPVANAQGFSSDICSYLTSDIGAYLKGDTPLARSYDGITSVPRPDVLVYSTNQCRDVKDWFQWYARKIGAPICGVESFHNVDDVTSDHIRAIAQQIQNLIPTLEGISGRRFDIDQFKEAVALSRQCGELWGQALRTGQHRPSPWSFFDAALHIGPAVVARGTPEAVDYYQLLTKELQSRVSKKLGAVPSEAHRLYWDGMPIWGKIRDLSNLFATQGACAVASTYANSWVFDELDEHNPFDSMAKVYTELFIVRSDNVKERYLKRMIETFQVDGMVFHDAKTCPNNSNTRYGLPRRLAQATGAPYVIIDGDLNDLRLYSEEQTITKIEAFIEQLQN